MNPDSPLVSFGVVDESQFEMKKNERIKELFLHILEAGCVNEKPLSDKDTLDVLEAIYRFGQDT